MLLRYVCILGKKLIGWNLIIDLFMFLVWGKIKIGFGYELKYCYSIL